MKILFLVSTDPRQTRHGGEQRVHFVWEGLKKLGNVYTVYPVAWKSLEKRDDADRIYAVQLERRYSPAWFLKRMMRAWNNHIMPPYYLTDKRIWKMGLPKPDVCVVRPASVAYGLDLLDRFPCFVDMDDIPSAEVEMMEKNFGRSFKTWLSLRLLERMQRVICRKARHVWIADEEELPRFAGTSVSFLPNIPVPPLPDFADCLGNENNLFFVGSLNSPPNFIALDWFLDNVWNEAKSVFPNLRLDIGGGGLPQRYKEKWASCRDVRLLGRVDDLRPYYKKALAIVAPMRIGSGTCLKVLEALRMGRPLLSTQQGLRGIRREYRNADNGIFPFEDAESFVAAMKSLLQCDRLATQRKAVSFVEMRNNQVFIDSTLRTDILGKDDEVERQLIYS